MAWDVIYVGLAILMAYLVYLVTKTYTQAFLALIESLLLTPVFGLFHLLIVYFVKKDIEKKSRR